MKYYPFYLKIVNLEIYINFKDLFKLYVRKQDFMCGGFQCEQIDTMWAYYDYRKLEIRKKRSMYIHHFSLCHTTIYQLWTPTSNCHKSFKANTKWGYISNIIYYNPRWPTTRTSTVQMHSSAACCAAQQCSLAGVLFAFKFVHVDTSTDTETESSPKAIAC